MERLNLNEGDYLVLALNEKEIVLKPLKPLSVEETWAEVSFEEVEEVGEEISKKLLNNS
ncbi:MAG: AbrB family transcriptional regulator [Candidatus Bathyarchaeales archaeon]